MSSDCTREVRRDEARHRAVRRHREDFGDHDLARGRRDAHGGARGRQELHPRRRHPLGQLRLGGSREREREAAGDVEAGDRFECGEVGGGDGCGGCVQRLGGRSGRDIDGHALIARNASAFRADERAAIDAAGIVDDANMIDAVAEDDAGRLRGRREVEVGDAGVAGKCAVNQKIGGERRIDEDAAIREVEMFVDEGLHRGAARIRLRAVRRERGHGAAARQNGVRIEREAAADDAADVGSGDAGIRGRRQRCADARDETGASIGIDERVVAGRPDVERDAVIGADVRDGDDGAPLIALAVVLHERERLVRGVNGVRVDDEGQLRAGECDRRIVEHELGGSERRPAER
jgi:hypothetical protein